MRVAIVHEWLTTLGGSEKVVAQMLRVLPQADLFTLVDFMSEPDRAFLNGRPVRTSFIQHLPGARKHYRRYLPLMPVAVEQFDVSDYDLVISSSHAVAKGVLTGPHQLHLCMCYSPMRYAWDLQHQYLAGAGLDRGLRGVLARWTLHRLRLWDARTANGVDQFIAISQFIARRIYKTYRRESVVIYPPVDLETFTLEPLSLRERMSASAPTGEGASSAPVIPPLPPGEGRGEGVLSPSFPLTALGSAGDPLNDFYLAASRMVPYKMTHVIVEAFKAMPARKLVVIGDGPDFPKVRRLAGSNVTFLGYQPDDVLRDHLRRARALVFAAEEDFGIVPVEAQACGTPVIAFSRGGAAETIIPGQTGLFFDAQTPDAIATAVGAFEALPASTWDPIRIRANVERFSEARFRQEFKVLVDREWERFRESRRPER